MRWTSLFLIGAAACNTTPSKDDDTDTTGDTDVTTDTDVIGDTDASPDTDVVPDTDVAADTDVTDTDVADTDVAVVVSDANLEYRFTFDGNTTDAGPNTLPLTAGTATYVADRHGTAGAALASGSCMNFGPQTYDGSSGAFTFSGWVKPSATFSGGTRQTFSGAGAGFFQLYRAGGQWTAEVYELIATNRRATFMSATTTATEEVWSHLAFAFDVTNGGTMYVDGVAVATSGSNWATVIQSGTGTLFIGCGGDAGFAADFDDTALWSRRLSETEIAALAAM